VEKGIRGEGGFLEEEKDGRVAGRLLSTLDDQRRNEPPLEKGRKVPITS